MQVKSFLFLRGKTYLIAVLAMLMFNACNRNVLFTANRDVRSNQSAASIDSANTEKLLMPGDKIMVSVWDHETLSVGSLQGVNSLDEKQGKWLMIDVNGETRLPQIGTVKLQGYTVRDATTFLEQHYAKFIQNPIITIRVLNNQVTVLGEVRSPGIYTISNDNIRLVDLIGNAQGFTDYAKTKKIKIIRGKDEMVVDLTNTASVTTNELRVIPGDVVYIPPNGGKAWERFTTKLIPIASLITAIALIYSVSNKSNN